MKLNPAPFKMIKSGKKTIELRLFDDKRSKISIGDEIVFTNTDTADQITASVVNMYRFNSFKDLYNELPLLKCGYTLDTVDKAHYSDMDRYYSVEEQKKYGVVGIEIKILTDLQF